MAVDHGCSRVEQFRRVDLYSFAGLEYLIGQTRHGPAHTIEDGYADGIGRRLRAARFRVRRPDRVRRLALDGRRRTADDAG